MKLIKPYFESLENIDGRTMLINIEKAGRTCYKSEDKMTDDSTKKFVEMIIRNGHESVLEHEKVSVRIICDRGVSHELVRHRIASFSQESTRYCNYSKDKHDSQLTFILPNWMVDDYLGEYQLGGEWETALLHDLGDKYLPEHITWLTQLMYSEKSYLFLLESGWKPQQARSVLPNALKTEIVVTANLREWRLIFNQRTSKKAHPQMREIMVPLLEKFQMSIPYVFDDIEVE